jgi:hypothetical protein
MSFALSSRCRVPRHASDVECTVLDAGAVPRFSVGWSTDDAAIVDAASDARAAIARSRRVREALVSDGRADLL